MTTLLLVAATVLSLTNEYAIVDFDDAGAVSALRERASSRGLLRQRAPFIALIRSGRAIDSNRTEYRDGRLLFSFPDSNCSAALSVVPFDGGWSFRVEEVAAPGAASVRFGQLYPSCCSVVGTRVNMVSDGTNAVCVRAYDIEGDMSCGRHWISASIPAGRAKGARFGLAAGSRAKITAMLRGMTVASGRVHTTAGGAWAVGSESSRQSYLNANMRYDRLDDWIDFMERGGFGILHFREDWYSCLGHYPVNTNSWPRGIADLKEAVSRIHDAGYLAGMHTLTACISPKDPWIAGDDNRYLRTRQEYTLAEDLAEDATELTVNEAPKGTVDVTFTYSGNGNQLRIGTEIVQFTGYTKVPPYRYTGLTRGTFGTRRAAHSKGDRADYLEQRYLAFYPEADSPLADKLADAIGNVFNTCGFDQIYTDGAEAGCGRDSGVYTGKMRDKIIGRCAAGGRPVINEDSCGGGNKSWWFHSRVGAWDSCWWAPKRFLDFHARQVRQAHLKDGDLLEVQMGWWAPVKAAYFWPSQKTDEMEYFASRVCGLDATMSIAGVDVSRRPIDFYRQRLITILGWYERARLARVFAPGVQEAMDVEGAEFRLRQDRADGVWKIAPVKCGTDMLTLAGKPAASALRVEMWYGGMSEREAKPMRLTTSHKAEDLKISTADKAIVMAASESATDEGERSFRLVATNGTPMARGAWAKASAEFSPHAKLAGCHTFRYRVKGDGSGALLNVQLHTAREYGGAMSEHYLKLDFTGWRDVETALRETDAESFSDYVWPYTNYAPIFHSICNADHIGDVSFYLNEIPAGGSAAVEVTDPVFVPQKKLLAEKSAVKVNGVVHAVPFRLGSGDFAEYDDGVWTHYSDVGQPLERRPAARPIEFAAGVNEIVYGGKTADGVRCRAAIRSFAIGEAKPAYRDVRMLDAVGRKYLSYEAADPEWFEPAKGFDSISPVVIRPGEKASVEFRVFGKIDGGSIEFGGRTYEIGNPDAWRGFRIKADGLHSGVMPVKLVAKDAACRVEVVKRYSE